MTEQVLKLYKSVYVVEDIVHNKLFMDSVQAHGVIKAQSIDDIPDGASIMFSTRGVSPKMLKKAEEKQLTIIDATCPVVKELQDDVITKVDAGYAIILIGNRAHQQISTLLGTADSNDIYVVNSEMDIDLLPDFGNKKVAYFTQTSIYTGDVNKIVDKLIVKIPDIEPGRADCKNNICSETLERQQIISEIASKIDLLIVVGSSHSANTTSLIRTGEANNIKKIICIESKDLIQKDILDNVERFALVSSTSINDETMKSVEDALQNLAGIEYVVYPENKQDNVAI